MLEAALAALYLEHGFETVAGPLVEAFESRIQYALFNQVDLKTELQETLARRGRSVVVLAARRRGPAARAPVHRGGGRRGRASSGSGRARSKKAAEQDAAREALTAELAEASRPPGQRRPDARGGAAAASAPLDSLGLACT